MVETRYTRAFRETRWTTASGIGSTKRSVIQARTAAFLKKAFQYSCGNSRQIGQRQLEYVHGWRLRFAAEMHNSGRQRCGFAEAVRGTRSNKRALAA